MAEFQNATSIKLPDLCRRFCYLDQTFKPPLEQVIFVETADDLTQHPNRTDETRRQLHETSLGLTLNILRLRQMRKRMTATYM